MKINWQEIGHEDYKAEIAGYVLRIEAMDNGLWWYQLYQMGSPLWHEYNFADTQKEAEEKIEKAIKNLLQ